MNQPSPMINNENSHPSFLSRLPFKDLGIVLSAVILQGCWLSAFISVKVGLLNCLPAFVFMGIWYWFTKSLLNIPYSRWYFLLAVVITLRLPVTVSPYLEFVNWAVYLTMIGLVGYKFFAYFKQSKQLIVLYLTTALVILNFSTHLFLDSPFTYSFRLANQLPSNYIAGQDNNLTWECSYEDSNIAVHCDMRHFIPSEKIFTEDQYDPSFSVFLSRFFYGYLNSLVGIQGHRWFMSVSLNIFLWISACIAVYRIGEIANLSERVRQIAMLCCGSSWGFVHFVAQPSPHMSAFAFAAIALWATLELIRNELPSPPLLILIILSGSITYDIYPLILISSLLLFIYKRPVLAISIPSMAIALNVIWKSIFLKHILGTVGNVASISSPSSNLTYSFQNWTKAILSLDFGRIWQLLVNGFMSYFYGGMIFGAIASTVFLIYLFIKRMRGLEIINPEADQLLLNICACFCGVMLVGMFFVAAQSEIWSPTKFLPRFAFYIYPINTIAIAFLSDKLLARWGYVTALLTFLVANSTLIKLASMSAFFEYGLVGWYWQ